MGLIGKENVLLEPKSSKRTEMKDFINGYLDGFWVKDVLSFKESPYCNLEVEKDRKIFSILDFTNIKSETIKLEFKYFFAYQIESKVINPRTTWLQYAHCFRKFIAFINQEKVLKDSIVEIRKEELLTIYRSWMVKNNFKITRANWKNKQQNVVAAAISFFNSVYDFFFDFYDEREEFEKDIWNFDRLGVDFNEASTKRCLDFTAIKEPWKAVTKRYIKERCVVIQEIVPSTGVVGVTKLTYFFSWLFVEYPDWTDLKRLTRSIVLKYLHYLRTTPMGGSRFQKKPTDEHVKTTMLCLSVFLDYIQVNEWEIAPTVPVKKLITSAEKPNSYKKRRENNGDVLEYIPDEVWEKVVENIDKLSNRFKIMALTIEESGFRITDICSLKLDCVFKDGKGGFWLKGDQRKVRKKNHKVPISVELAIVLQAQIEAVKLESNEQNNPKNYLFPILNGRRVGKPVSTPSIARVLNKLAEECDIYDKDGKIFHFRAHQFRHRYGMILVNKGVNIIIIQELMAHASPEMTVVYAKLLDNTKREAWETSREQGALRLESNGIFTPVQLESSAEENGIELEWIRHNYDSLRMDHGYCIKSPKMSCSFLEEMIETPCIKNNCRSFHVDNTFVDYYQSQIIQLEQDIILYKRQGRVRSVELSEKRIQNYKKILSEIKGNGGIFGIPKDKREIFEDERILKT
ncbi:tyrosine-type recombinase/integrase [Rummeliibacillus stabekisii]|uniref:tyrosine-type recombinase/integrase n=1 Tax=Rummeliibacillus stabekisii TaxID=241244 RepID=UPI003715A0B6